MMEANLIYKENPSIQELVKEVESQFSQGNTNGFNEPMALITIHSGETLEIIKDENLQLYSMLIYNAQGNPMLPYYNANTIEELLETVFEY